MEKLEIKFGEFRKYLDIVSFISVCDANDLTYENFRNSLEVPESYDDYYVYGIGLKDELFPDRFHQGEKSFQPCMEVMISKTPREYKKPERNI